MTTAKTSSLEGSASGSGRPATFVLVSGAWHAGWCWERLTPLLESAGHRVIAPDLRGMGSDPTPLSEVTLAMWADQIADIIRLEPEPVILVGHSRGGIIISEVAERAPDRISTLVYLTAFLLPDGQSIAATLGLGADTPASDILIPGADGTTTIEAATVGPRFYNTTDPVWVERATQRLRPEPMAAFATPLGLTEARFGAVKRAYIECVEDRAIPLALQRAMRQTLPCDPVLHLPTDHSPFYSAPEALAVHLCAIADVVR